MKIADLAEKTGYSVASIRRMAASRKIPACRRTKGGHYRFEDTEKLNLWVQKHRKGWCQGDYKAPLAELIRYFNSHSGLLDPRGQKRADDAAIAVRLRHNLKEDIQPLLQWVRDLKLA